MSDRNLEYIVNYIGPVIFVKKKTIQYRDEVRKLHTCSNKKCSEHGKDIFHYHYCIKCGSEINYVKCETGIRYEVYPTSLDDNFDNNYIPMTKHHSNGLTMFNEIINLSEDEAVYAPYFEQDSEFNCGIQAYIELGKYCQNESCEDFDECAPSDHDYCSECGHKNKIHKDVDITSSFSEKLAKSILKTYGVTTNLSVCEFIENDRFTTIVDEFRNSEKCKQGIDAIEKAYGKGSATIKLAFIQYHQNY